MRRWHLTIAVILWTAWGSTQVRAMGLGLGEGRPETWHDAYPWLGDFTAAIAGIALLCVLVYFLRPSVGSVADFSIEVDGADVSFRGRFPPELEGSVEDFLVNDCRVEGAYEVTGKWEEGRLVVRVRGENAKIMEQRIRNFLKLNVKRAA